MTNIVKLGLLALVVYILYEHFNANQPGPVQWGSTVRTNETTAFSEKAGVPTFNPLKVPQINSQIYAAGAMNPGSAVGTSPFYTPAFGPRENRWGVMAQYS